MATLAELQADLAIVDAAIEQLLLKKSVTRLEVRSGNFGRVYQYQEITLESLLALKRDLQQQIAALTEESPTFRVNATIPLIVNKGIF